MEILIFGLNDAIHTEEIVDTLVQNPLPNGYIYTAVSYLTPSRVRVQAMQAVLANAILDTGERVSETADNLQSAIDMLLNRLIRQGEIDYSCPEERPEPDRW